MAVSPSPNPSPTGREVVLSSGKDVIRGTFMFDFEKGAGAKPDGADVWWEQVDSTRRYLVPENGAMLARVGVFQFEPVSSSYLRDLKFSVAKIDGSNAPSNQLVQGTVVGILTRHRHLAKMLVEQYGYDLIIAWVTYE